MARSARFLILLMLAGICHAGLIALTFSESPTVVGTGYSIQGVTFTWSNPSSFDMFVYGATIGTGGGPLGNITLLDDPVLEGVNDGTVAIHFESATSNFSLALAVCCGLMTGGIGGTVTTGGSQSIPVNLILPEGFVSEGQFSYSGTPITDATLSFSNDANTFAIDKFTFETSIPEPASALLTAAGLLAGIAWARKKARTGPKTLL